MLDSLCFVPRNLRKSARKKKYVEKKRKKLKEKKNRVKSRILFLFATLNIITLYKLIKYSFIHKSRTFFFSG